MPGEKLELTCGANAYPKPTISWLINTKRPDDTLFKIQQVDNQKDRVASKIKSIKGLTINTTIVVECSGEHYDEKGKLRRIRSLTQVSVIASPPKRLNSKARNLITTVDGGRAELPCPYFASPRPNYVWQYISAQGEVGVKIKNRPKRQAWEADFGLTTPEIMEIPEMSNQFTPFNELPISLKSSEKPDFSFRESRASIFTTVENGSYIIPQVKKSNAGKWKCTATNQFGNDSLIVTLNVLEPTKLIYRPPNDQLDVNRGKSINLELGIVTDKYYETYKLRGLDVDDSVYWTYNGRKIADNGAYDKTNSNQFNARLFLANATVRFYSSFSKRTQNRGAFQTRRKCVFAYQLGNTVPSQSPSKCVFSTVNLSKN